VAGRRALLADGKQIAYHVQVNGRPEVFVGPSPPLARAAISPAGGVQPQWCNDGRELIYLSPDGQVMSVAMSDERGAPPSVPRPLFDGRLLPSAHAIRSACRATARASCCSGPPAIGAAS
jgi:hypothetical protein